MVFQRFFDPKGFFKTNATMKSNKHYYNEREREGKRERVCERNYNSKWENYYGKYNDLVKCLSVKSHKILKL